MSKPFLDDVVEILSCYTTNRTVEISHDKASVVVQVVKGKRMTWIDSNILVRLHEITGGYTLALKPDGRLFFRLLTEEEKSRRE